MAGVADVLRLHWEAELVKLNEDMEVKAGRRPPPLDLPSLICLRRHDTFALWAMMPTYVLACWSSCRDRVASLSGDTRCCAVLAFAAPFCTFPCTTSVLL